MVMLFSVALLATAPSIVVDAQEEQQQSTARPSDPPGGTGTTDNPKAVKDTSSVQETSEVDYAIEVVGVRQAKTPNTHVGIDAERIQETVAVRNSEDALKYLPSLFVRKRHIGDTQAPVATRTTGVSASARSLIYADGVLLSALVGNNNTFASPKWGMVSPEEIVRVDVLYGPYAASYPGNAVGAVVNITTHMPKELQASAKAAGSWQHFSQYATEGWYPAYQLAGTIGDKLGRFSWFLSANHVESKSQPLAYVTVARPASTSTSGVPVSGFFSDTNRIGVPIYNIGAGGLEDQTQNSLKIKAALELTDELKLTWRTGLFLNKTESDAETYLTDAVGVPVYSGTVNIEGRSITIPASAFSNVVYALKQRQTMHAVTLQQNAADFTWALIGSVFDFNKDDQRLPSTALPVAREGGRGSLVRMGGTGWRTLDLNASTDLLANQTISAGVHWDRFTLKNRRFDVVSNWRDGTPGALLLEARGHTRSMGIFLQDQWTIQPGLQLTLGGRYEKWRAFGGRNFSSAPALDVNQPSLSAHAFSPKASLRWQPLDRWVLTLSAGRAVRFPTVSELYQAVTTGATITVPNPNLKPEKDWSQELAVERQLPQGRVRLSFFHEEIKDALISQAAPLLPGSTTLFNYVQNVEKTRTYGLELVADHRNILPRLDVSGSLTLLDPKIVSDSVLPAAEGKLIPQVPRRRGTLVLTYRPTDKLSLTGAARYSSKLYGTIDNSDKNGHTYQGFEGYFVADARAVYKLSPKIDFAVGVENLTDKRYFLFHPFPGRTFTAEVSWDL